MCRSLLFFLTVALCRQLSLASLQSLSRDLRAQTQSQGPALISQKVGWRSSLEVLLEMPPLPRSSLQKRQPFFTRAPHLQHPLPKGCLLFANAVKSSGMFLLAVPHPPTRVRLPGYRRFHSFECRFLPFYRCLAFCLYHFKVLNIPGS